MLSPHSLHKRSEKLLEIDSEALVQERSTGRLGSTLNINHAKQCVSASLFN